MKKEMNEIPTPETEMAYTPQPRDSAYAQFHAERRQKLLAYIEDRVAEHVAGGGNDSLSYRMDCAYDGMLTLPGHTDRDIWNAAWEACIAQSTQTAPKPCTKTQ